MCQPLLFFSLKEPNRLLTYPRLSLEHSWKTLILSLHCCQELSHILERDSYWDPQWQPSGTLRALKGSNSLRVFPYRLNWLPTSNIVIERRSEITRLKQVIWHSTLSRTICHKGIVPLCGMCHKLTLPGRAWAVIQFSLCRSLSLIKWQQQDVFFQRAFRDVIIYTCINTRPLGLLIPSWGQGIIWFRAPRPTSGLSESGAGGRWLPGALLYPLRKDPHRV